MATSLSMTIPHFGPSYSTSRANPDKARIRPLFETLWNERSDGNQRHTYEQIATKITAQGFPVQASCLKKWRREWKLPQRYFSADQKRRCAAGTLSQWTSPQSSSHGAAQVIPSHLIERQRRADSRPQRGHRRRVETRTSAVIRGVPDHFTTSSFEIVVEPGKRQGPVEAAHVQSEGTSPMLEQSLPKDPHQDDSFTLSSSLWELSCGSLEEEDAALEDNYFDYGSAILEEIPSIDPNHDCDFPVGTVEGPHQSNMRALAENLDAAESTTRDSEEDPDYVIVSPQARSNSYESSPASSLPDKTPTSVSGREWGSEDTFQLLFYGPSDPSPAYSLPLPLDLALRAAHDCVIWLGASGRLVRNEDRWISSRNGTIKLGQVQHLQPWRSYSSYYNATILFKYNKSSAGDQLLGNAMEKMLQALLYPTLRVLSDVLLICFTCLVQGSAATRWKMRHNMSVLLQRARELGIGRQSGPLLTVLEATLQLDVADVGSKIQMIRWLLDLITAGSPAPDFDAEYEIREQLARLWMQLGNLIDAKEACTELIGLAARVAGFDSNDTYRARRLMGRILIAEGHLDTAEYELKRIPRDYQTNKATFRQSAAKKEWDVSEDLKEIAFRRGNHEMEDHYYELALQHSIENYGERNPNTLRILGDFWRSLAKRSQWAKCDLLRSHHTCTYDTLVAAT